MMIVRRIRSGLSLAVLCLAVSAGCGDASNPNAAPTAGGPGGPPPGGGGGSGGGPETGIKPIMARLARGPNSLTPTLGRELKEAEPPWPTIQSQAKEYLGLASDMAKLTPPKGSQESWAALGAEYVAMASELAKAADAKDKAAALDAHGRLTNSCNACHKEHRVMGPGGRGGPPGGPGGPPGGPPR